jgi:hypothetical protein
MSGKLYLQNKTQTHMTSCLHLWFSPGRSFLNIVALVLSNKPKNRQGTRMVVVRCCYFAVAAAGVVVVAVVVQLLFS